MMRRPRSREAKRIKVARTSTIEEKWRRHKNKMRIWQRCVKKLALSKAQA